MNRRRSWALALCLATFAAATALAEDEEKILVLKNGFRVRGLLRSRSETTIVVMTSRGKLTFPRADVVSIEDATPSSSLVALPGSRKAAPGLVPVPDSPTPTTPAPTAPVTAPVGSASQGTAAVETATAAARKSFALATREELDAARALLVAVPPLPGLDEVDPERRAALVAGRDQAIADVGSRIGLATIVGLVAAPVPDRDALVAHELANQLLLAAGVEARPFVLRAISELDFARPSSLPQDLLAAGERLGDDAQGSLERLLDAKLDETVRQDVAPVVLLPLLEKIGTRRSLSLLYKLLLVPADDDASEPVTDACRAILARDAEPASALAPLLRRLDVLALPAPTRLRAILELAAIDKSAAPLVAQVVDALERGGLASSEPEEQDACFEAAFATLAKIGTDAARRALLVELIVSRTETRRLQVYAALATLGRLDAKTPEDQDLLARVVERLEAPGAFPHEPEAIARTLQALTGEASRVTTAEDWRAVIEKLAR